MPAAAVLARARRPPRRPPTCPRCWRGRRLLERDLTFLGRALEELSEKARERETRLAEAIEIQGGAMTESAITIEVDPAALRAEVFRRCASGETMRTVGAATGLSTPQTSFLKQRYSDEWHAAKAAVAAGAHRATERLPPGFLWQALEQLIELAGARDPGKPVRRHHSTAAAGAEPEDLRGRRPTSLLEQSDQARRRRELEPQLATLAAVEGTSLEAVVLWLGEANDDEVLLQDGPAGRAWRVNGRHVLTDTELVRRANVVRRQRGMPGFKIEGIGE